MKKEIALRKINDAANKGALVYVSKDEISELPEEYMVSVTELIFKNDDFSDVGKGKFYPEKSATNRISLACGISYTENCGIRTVGEESKIKYYELKNGNVSKWQCEGEFTVYGKAQGTRKNVDGTLITSPILEYEFNVSDRYNLDRLGNDKYPPKNLFEARKKFLELKKFATQRAATGAQLTVVRNLAAIPTGFKKEDISKPMLFGQYVKNPEYKAKILNEMSKTSDGRLAIINNTMEAGNNLYGKQISAPEENEVFENETISEAEIVQDDKPEDNNSVFGEKLAEGELSPLEVAKLDLETYLNDPIIQSSKKYIVGIERMMADETITVETLKVAIQELERFKKEQV